MITPACVRSSESSTVCPLGLVLGTTQVFDAQKAAGKSEAYAQAYASKVGDGDVYARHFATIRYCAPPRTCVPDV